MALWSLILGILFFVPFAGLVAIILGIIALVKGTRRKGMAIAGIILPVLVLPLLISILLPSLSRTRGLAQQAACKANLNAIGKSIRIYQADNKDVMPPSFDVLMAEDYFVSPQILRCPAVEAESNVATAQPGSTGDLIHYETDYFYRPVDSAASPDSIIACDYRSNHPDGVRNVLFADGSVARMDEPDFQRSLGEPQNVDFAAALQAEDH
jgi:prepilin-type processing-associated H-X9-DG protein